MNANSISLAKALKLKNRLAGRINRVEQDITAFNSVLTEQANQVDVKALWGQREEMSAALTVLKSTIMATNQEIQPFIIRQAELRATIAFLKGLSTQDGLVRHSYQNTDMVYVAALKKADVDAKINAYEDEIDNIQDRLDEFNQRTKIDIPDRYLELVR